MSEIDRPIRRKADMPETFLEVMISHDGDVFFVVNGKDIQGRFHQVQLEFIAPAGGGYHPKTLNALYNLASAIEEDNRNPESVRRYGAQ